MSRWIFLFTGLIVWTPALASAQMTFEEALQEGRSFGSTAPKGKDAANALITDGQSRGIPGLTPEAQSDAETQGSFFLDNPDQLTPQGENALSATESGRFLQESYNLRPRITIAPDDPIVTFSEGAASGESCITRRVCTNPVTETITTTQQIACTIEYAETGGQCSYPLPRPTTVQGNGSGSLCVDHHLYARIHRASATVYHLQLLDTGPRGDLHRNCGGSGSGGGIGDWHTIEILTLSASPTVMRLDVSASGRGCPSASVTISSPDQSVLVVTCGRGGAQLPSYTYTYRFDLPPPPLSPETVRAACSSFMNERCALINEQCTSASCTRSYVCIDPARQIDGCAAYRSQPSCTIHGGSCLLSNAYGQCFSRQESYACTTQTHQERCAEEGIETICPGSVEGIRCLDPNECADTASIPNTDLPLAASNIGALAAAEDDHTGDPVIIFTGSREFCRKTIASGVTRDCCALETLLLGCNSAEETLQAHRNAGQCVEVGTYCSRRVDLEFTTVCVERSTGFCCFSSKLTRIIQEQGRSQLGIGWGTPQAPDCRGLTVEELQRIDFERVDFSEYYADIMADPPDPDELAAQAQSSGALTPNPEGVPPPPLGISPDQVQRDLEQFFGTRAP
ncbi:conjugal transfer protein TraN [Candidatus Manganitrophus noduliformans]|nr:conjugal transfer protein TraN [Candidatus Manganitrophus noduliformans]